MSDIVNFLSGKTLFITGATGFLANGLVEKILRHVPDVGRVYLLIRPKRLPDGSILSAEERLEREVLNSNAFARLREISGECSQDVLRQKTVAVAGDLTLDHLGISPDVYHHLMQEVQIVINSAASVTFDERIDHALQLNTLGAKRVVEFARACRKAILLHVSTAYVSGQRTGRIPEAPLAPDRTMAQEIGLDPSEKPYDLDHEIREILAFSKRVHEDSRRPEQQEEFRRAALKQSGQPPTTRWLDAQVETLRKRWLKRCLIEEGMRRAKRLGWHDSYTLTKAMGEQLIVKTRGDLPTAIIRPSIIESSLVEPEPGWVDGLKVADPLIDAFSRGRLLDFPANPSIVIDIVPVDVVVNTILAVLPRLARDSGLTVYQVATGSQNPLKFHELFDFIHEYFREHPRLNKQGEAIPVNGWSFPTFERFRRRNQLRYLVPLSTVQWVAERCSWIPAMARLRQRVTVLKSSFSRMMYYAEIYSPYTTLDCQFETKQIQQLYDRMDPEDQRLFNFDVTRIRWKEYIQDIHIPGLKRHVLKTDAPEVDEGVEGESADRSGLDQERGEEGLSPSETIGDILR